MTTNEEARALFHRLDRMRDSGICSPTTRALLDDAAALIRAAAPDHQAEAPSDVAGLIHELRVYAAQKELGPITVPKLLNRAADALAARPVVDDVEALAQALGQKRFEEYREKFGGVSDPTYWINLERKELTLASRRIENARAAIGGDQ